MKRVSIVEILVFFIALALASCRQQPPPPVTEEKSVGESRPSVADNVRVYEYDNEWDLEGLSENHMIVLETHDERMVGRYYGTSDDFDDDREGYQPGFFVAPMDSLQIANGRIHFSLRVIRATLFDNPIDPRFTSAAQARAAGYTTWLDDFADYQLSRSTRSYTGTYSDARIVIQMHDEKRVFKAIKSIARQDN